MRILVVNAHTEDKNQNLKSLYSHKKRNMETINLFCCCEKWSNKMYMYWNIQYARENHWKKSIETKRKKKKFRAYSALAPTSSSWLENYYYYYFYQLNMWLRLSNQNFFFLFINFSRTSCNNNNLKRKKSLFVVQNAFPI